MDKYPRLQNTLKMTFINPLLFALVGVILFLYYYQDFLDGVNLNSMIIFFISTFITAYISTVIPSIMTGWSIATVEKTKQTHLKAWFVFLAGFLCYSIYFIAFIMLIKLLYNFGYFIEYRQPPIFRNSIINGITTIITYKLFLKHPYVNNHG